MPSVPIWQVDAFADRPFTGNPAAVCILDEPRDDAWLQAVASEMNLAETAFLRPRDDGFDLRWFTPEVEVPLCGHATLASAHTLWENGFAAPDQTLRFHTQSGLLTAERRGDFIELNFPATPVEEAQPPAGLFAALRLAPESVRFVGRTKFDCLLLLETAEEVRRLKPDFGLLATIETRGVMVTAAANDPRHDVVSRCFFPSVGINEDPVTGSAHCALAPFWAPRLGNSMITAYQASRRGGVVRATLQGDRVLLAGRAVTVLKGELV